MAEYGIILALIAAVVIALLVTLGTDIKNALQSLVNQL
jgi:Flp pilus assembly pilin Flp